MPETDQKKPSPSHLEHLGVVHDPRLRAGRNRILRHASRRGASIGAAIGLPLATILYLTDPSPDRGLFTALGLMLLLACGFSLHQRHRARAVWPRIWDSTIGDVALVETIACNWHSVPSDHWSESLRARSAHIPLPTPEALALRVPHPGLLPSLLLTCLALFIGSQLAPFKVDPAESTPVALDSTQDPSGQVDRDRQLLQQRQDAALALSGRATLEALARQLRGISDASEPPAVLLPRDRSALAEALQRLDEADPLRPLVERWQAADRRSGDHPAVAVDGAEGTGEAVASDPSAAASAGTLDTDLADGGLDQPTTLRPVSQPSGDAEADVTSARIGQDQDDGPGIDQQQTVSAVAADSAATWDRVRDDPRLEAHWIQVIDLYRALLRGRERDGGG
ncbi:MAG: hypothetical protein DSY81_03710 [Bacillota bacterium]|nr:MAG: hypothetical protein DSY92_06790 [Planctomycetota bacterium]RUA10325.1 MAG: hypothetical protein DSY81_03710 [Bacillota bacterium]